MINIKIMLRITIYLLVEHPKTETSKTLLMISTQSKIHSKTQDKS
jgi:hypothetical protein